MKVRDLVKLVEAAGWVYITRFQFFFIKINPISMTIVLEKTDDMYGAWLEDCPEAFSGIHTMGVDENEVIANVRMLMFDFLKHDFPNDPEFVGFDPNTITFQFKYSLLDFFDTYKYIKMSAIADKAGINRSLVRQYASGAASASAAQAKKIQEAVHSLAHSLLQVSVM